MSGLAGFLLMICMLQYSDAQVTGWSQTGYSAVTGTLNMIATLTAKVPENSAAATTLFSAVATKGGGVVVNTITSGNTGTVFEIDAAGAVKLSTGKSLDFETTPSYTLMITAVETGQTAATGTLTLTVSIKNVLEFGKTTYNVCMADGATTDTTVGTYTVSDNTASTTVVYAIASGNTNTDFTITAAGVLKVAAAKTLAQKTTAKYTLGLSATETGGAAAADPGATTVTITVGTCGCSGVAATLGVTLLAMVVAFFA